MKKIYALMAILALSFSVNADALTVRTEALSSGTYEDGEYTKTNEKFEAEYVIDEEAATIKRQNVYESTREGRDEEVAVYDITNAMASEGLSALMVSRKNMRQKIYTGIKDDEIDSVELIMIGETFYQICMAANGKFYIEYGKVEKISD